jgi:diguanylate cyclase (GGDEF)-like protein
MRILIVEDSALQAHFLRGLLESMGHQPKIARHGDEAWRVLQQEPFPLVLSDWVMPGLDGPALCRRIRQRPGGSYTYVILLTVLGRRQDRIEGLQAGADDFLVKPVDAEELAARLEIARRILEVQARLERQNERLEELAATDELTGLSNRRGYLRALEVGSGLAGRRGLPLSLVLLDVDHFKSFNDEFGHPAGDEVLREVGAVLKGHCREHDTAARHGGEEFAVVLLGSGPADAAAVAERLRAAVAGRRWRRRPVTVSCGAASLAPGLSDPDGLVDRADRALYASKRRGRNCVTHDDGGAGPGVPAGEPAVPVRSLLAP